MLKFKIVYQILVKLFENETAQSMGPVKCTNCISAEDNIPPKFPLYDTKTSDGKAPVLELLGMLSTPSLLLLPGPLWPEVVIPIRVPSIGQTELFDDLYANKWLMLNWIVNTT